MDTPEYEEGFRVYTKKEYWLEPLRVNPSTPDYLAKSQLHALLWDRFNLHRFADHGYIFLTCIANSSREVRVEVDTNHVSLMYVPDHTQIRYWSHGVFPGVYDEIITVIVNSVFSDA